MAGFLLDTNVVGKLVKVVPAPQVLAWVDAQTADTAQIGYRTTP
jgi:predicted nucleic acid-binding protein